MPVYEYSCDQCENTFEVNASFFEELDAPECPQCHGKETRKKFSFFMSSKGRTDINGASSCGGGGRFT